MSNADIFGSIPEDGKTPMDSKPPLIGAPRLLRPDRHQMRFVPTSLDSLVEEDHRVRGVWAVIEKLDLTGFEEEIAARGETAGRSAIDPRILVGYGCTGRLMESAASGNWRGCAMNTTHTGGFAAALA